MRFFTACKRDVSLNVENPLSFVICQWQKTTKPNVVYLAYRVVLSLYFSTTLLYSIIESSRASSSAAYKVKWMVYLSYWTYIVCTLQAIWGAVLLFSCIKAVRLRNPLDRALRTYKVYWVLHTIALDNAILVTLYYWVFIYDSKAKIDEINLFLHTLNIVIMKLDFFLLSHPIHLLHVWYSIAYGLFYGLVNAIYCLSGGISREGHHYIYKPLNWKNPGKSVLVLLGTTVIMIIIHILCWTLCWVRIYLRSVIMKRRMYEQDEEIYHEENV